MDTVVDQIGQSTNLIRIKLFYVHLHWKKKIEKRLSSAFGALVNIICGYET